MLTQLCRVSESPFDPFVSTAVTNCLPNVHCRCHTNATSSFFFYVFKMTWWSRGPARPRRSAPAPPPACTGRGWASMPPRPPSASRWWALWAAPSSAASPRWRRAWGATPWTSSRCAPAWSWPWLADGRHRGTGPSAHGIALGGSGPTCPFLLSSASFLLLRPSLLHSLRHRANSRPQTYSPLTRHWGN